MQQIQYTVCQLYRACSLAVTYNGIHTVYLLTLIWYSHGGLVIKIYWFSTNPHQLSCR